MPTQLSDRVGRADWSPTAPGRRGPDGVLAIASSVAKPVGRQALASEVRSAYRADREQLRADGIQIAVGLHDASSAQPQRLTRERNLLDRSGGPHGRARAGWDGRAGGSRARLRRRGSRGSCATATGYPQHPGADQRCCCEPSHHLTPHSRRVRRTANGQCRLRHQTLPAGPPAWQLRASGCLQRPSVEALPR